MEAATTFNKTVLFLIYQSSGSMMILILVKTIPEISDYKQMVRTRWGYGGVRKKEVNISVL